MSIMQTARTDRCIYTELSRALWSGGSSYESLDKSSCKNVELRDVIYRQTVGRYTGGYPETQSHFPQAKEDRIFHPQIDRIFLPQISCSYSVLSTVIIRINITMLGLSLLLTPEFDSANVNYEYCTWPFNFSMRYLYVNQTKCAHNYDKITCKSSHVSKTIYSAGVRMTIDGKSIVSPSGDGYLRNTLYTSYPTARYWFSITSESPPVYNRAILSALFLTFVQRVRLLSRKRIQQNASMITGINVCAE